MQHRAKERGAYYTPHDAVAALVRWAVRSPSDRLLDPAAGDGRFLALHNLSVGVEQDEQAAAVANQRAPGSLVHHGDFFGWAKSTEERFDCAAGNPPFIRYQRFAGAVRECALALCHSLGATFSGLTSSWAPFLVATASLLKPGGRMAFVVPAEIGHAPYAKPLLGYLTSHFSDVRLIAVREKIFAGLSEDAWLLYASGFGNSTNQILLVSMDRFIHSDTPPATGVLVRISDLESWGYRLRPFLAPSAARDLYREIASEKARQRLGDIALVGIGYVTGANDFFHLRPSLANKLKVPNSLLRPTVRNGRLLKGTRLTDRTVQRWIADDDPCLLLRLTKEHKLPQSVERYLNSEEGRQAQSAYKCRTRSPWYVVPDVTVPDAFLSYMSSGAPTLVTNQAKCSCTNSVHVVRLRGNVSISRLHQAWRDPFTALSCEFEGHPLGGGLLKLEPGEAQRIVLAGDRQWQKLELRTISEGITALRQWRHSHGGQEEQLPGHQSGRGVQAVRKQS